MEFTPLHIGMVQSKPVHQALQVQVLYQEQVPLPVQTFGFVELTPKHPDTRAEMIMDVPVESQLQFALPFTLTSTEDMEVVTCDLVTLLLNKLLL